VLPAHEDRGRIIGELDPPRVRTAPLGAHTMLTRSRTRSTVRRRGRARPLPDELVLVGDALGPEGRQRIDTRWSATSSSRTGLRARSLVFKGA